MLERNVSYQAKVVFVEMLTPGNYFVSFQFRGVAIVQRFRGCVLFNNVELNTCGHWEFDGNTIKFFGRNGTTDLEMTVD